MHIKRISKKVRMCIMASLLIFTSAFSVLIGYQCQQKKVKDLQNELKMKKDMDNKNKGSYSTILNAQDIQLKFNEVNSYKIFSGTTGIACMNTNRKFIGIELEEKYFDIAKERIEEVNN